MLPGVQRVWGNEPPHSQVNSHCMSWSPKRTPKFLEHNCRGQNPSAQKFLFIIEKLLKHRCLKWARIAHLDIWNTSHDQRKGWEWNWHFDSRPLRVGNRPDFVTCRWHAMCRWKNLDKSYNFVSNLIVIEGLHAKLCAPKVGGVPTVRISGLPFGSLKTKSHLDMATVERRKVYYEGVGGGFPQVRTVVSLVSPRSPVVRLSTKSAPTMH
jgi:hypothetical protein